MRMRKFILIGGLLLLLMTPAVASNGNPRIPSATPGHNAALVFCGAKPRQDDNATVGNLKLLATPANYYIDTTAYSGWTKYGIVSTPITTNNGYLLLDDSANEKYAVVKFTLGSPVGPADESITDITWYKKGDPAPPQNISVEAGYESAKITWALDPDYDYANVGVNIHVKDSSGNWQYVWIPGNQVAYVPASGPNSHLVGELLDGRVLSPGKDYKVTLIGRVIRSTTTTGASYYQSAPVSVEFKTAVPPKKDEVTLTFNDGLNFFSLGIPPNAETGHWYRLVATQVSNIGHIITALNGIDAVSTFGYVDADGNVKGVKQVGGSFSGNIPLNTPLSATQGYQIYIKTGKGPKTLTIKNYTGQ
jgi:hypothetical protein